MHEPPLPDGQAWAIVPPSYGLPETTRLPRRSAAGPFRFIDYGRGPPRRFFWPSGRGGFMQQPLLAVDLSEVADPSTLWDLVIEGECFPCDDVAEDQTPGAPTA
jgi:hypothetical protein